MLRRVHHFDFDFDVRFYIQLFYFTNGVTPFGETKLIWFSTKLDITGVDRRHREWEMSVGEVKVEVEVVVPESTLDRREANTRRVHKSPKGLESGALHAQPLRD
jgi:hypothetical protein